MSTAPSPESVAIVGMAGRFPQAATLDEFWSNLRSGKESITTFAAEDAQWLPIERRPAADDPRVVRARAVLDRAEWFDPVFFHLSPRDAALMDPQHRVFLECAWEALENAGCDPQTFDGSIGVFAGSGFNTYLFSNLLSNGMLLDDYGLFPAITLNDKDYLATRVAYKFDLRGPCLNIQTACSTSLVAVCVACQNLLTYACDVALAGGVSIPFPVNRGHEHVEGGIMSHDGHCRAFDAAATGTVLGGGAGAVVLKRLNDALAAGDRICAIIRGSAMNNDGAAKIGYTAPSIDGQAECVALAQSAAGVDAETISYIEAHGTGTPLGDPIEIAALTKAFGPVHGRTGFCAVGSLKTNIGHLDIAAGVAGLIKTTLALQRGEIPPSLHYHAPNPQIDFQHSPFFVNDRLRPWPRTTVPRRAGVSSFGIGGTNAHVVLEEAPLPAASSPSRPGQLLLFSARTATALDAAIGNLAAHLGANPDVNLADAAFTLQVGRKRFEHRRAFVVTDIDDATRVLRSYVSDRSIRSNACPPCAAPGDAGTKVAFLFPGQGAQAVGMAQGVYHADPPFRACIDQGCDVLRPALGADLRSMLFPDHDPAGGEAMQRLSQTQITQPALFLVEYALAQLWTRWGITPHAMLGHSLGEYVAACLAGVFSFEEALALVATRAQLMHAQPPGAMLAVRLPEQDVAPLLTEGLTVAAVNGPSACVLSGSFDAIAALERRLAASAIAARRLATSHAFHSPMLQLVAAPLAAQLRRMTLHRPTARWISNLTGTWITPEQAIDPNYWTAQMLRPVRFADGVAELLRSGIRLFLEVGPGRTLGALARQQAATARQPVVVASSLEASHPPLGDRGALLHALGALWVGGARPDWRQGFYADEPRQIVALPTYPFERTRCWTEPGTDRQALDGSTGTVVKAADAAAGAEPARAAPPTAAEVGATISRLAALFRELSGIEVIGDPDRSFTEWGFDSLFLAQVSAAIARRFDVSIPFRRMRDELCTVRKLGDAIEAQTQPRADEAPAAVATVCASRLGTRVPLTETQREIWVVSQLGAAASGAYVESATLQLDGPVDPAALQRALTTLVGRHEALRTTFAPQGDVQVIAPQAACPLVLHDLTGASRSPDEGPASDPTEQRGARCLEAELTRPFDFSAGPLFRPVLIRTADTSYLLALIVHHIICDGWSLGVIVRELAELYSAEAAGRAPTLAPPRSFAAYVAQHGSLPSAVEQAAAAYWQQRYGDAVPVVEMPTDRPRPAQRTYAGSVASISVSPALSQSIRRYGVEQESTLFTILLSAFSVLVHRLTGQPDVVIGVPAAAQALGGEPDLVGHFANLLPIRSRLAADQPFHVHLAETKRHVSDALEHWQYPFVRILEQLKLPRDATRVPLTPVLFNTNHFRGQLAFGAAATTLTLPPKHFVNFDLAFNLAAVGESLVLGCYYSTELFEGATITRWLRHFETLLAAIIADPARPVAELPLLTAAERRQILVEWNATTLPYDRDATIADLFAAQVARRPDAVALVSDRERITYRELDARAERLAERLRRTGVAADTPVGLCANRSPHLLVGILGILKAGAAYLPLDPGYPGERLEYIVNDARTSLLVTERSALRRLPPGDYDVLLVDDEGPRATRAVSTHGRAGPLLPPAERLAYVIYTSGSTGRPKGVAITQRCVTALVAWAGDLYTREELDGVLFATSASFDISIFEIFCPLCLGGKIILADNVLQLGTLAARNEIRFLSGVPPAMAEVVRAGLIPPSVTTVALAGEQFPQPLVDALYALGHIRRVFELYGPTETTVYSTGGLRQPNTRPTLGRPFPNEQIYILDEHLQPVPIGVRGEIYIGGDKLARGYLHRPELTAEKFVPNPLAEKPRPQSLEPRAKREIVGPALSSELSAPSSQPALRLYRTGDLGRWVPDGSIESLGRTDHQVKVRGFRIELGEIEAVLARHPAIAECSVIARPDAHGATRLLAYLAFRPNFSPPMDVLREHLIRELPAYMLPAAISVLRALPRNANGKIDRAALPEPTFAATDGTEDPPSSEIEKVIGAVWSDVLGVSAIGRHDNFFALGGNSLHAMQVITRVRELLSIDLAWVQFFATPTVAGLAAQAESALIRDIQRECPAPAEAPPAPVETSGVGGGGDA